MIPLNQSEINVYKNAFSQFENKLSDTCALITWDDMPKLLRELGKAHSETDAKTLFNELEIAGDGSGWILDLTTFMVMMMHSGHKKPSLKRASVQWKYLMKNGSLISTETIPEDTNELTKHIEDALTRHAQSKTNQSDSVTGGSDASSAYSNKENNSNENNQNNRNTSSKKHNSNTNSNKQQTSDNSINSSNKQQHNNNSNNNNKNGSNNASNEVNINGSSDLTDDDMDTVLIANIIEDEARYKYKCFDRSQSCCVRYPNYQVEYGIEFPAKKTVQDLARAALSQTQDPSQAQHTQHLVQTHHDSGKVGFADQQKKKSKQQSIENKQSPKKSNPFACLSCLSSSSNTSVQ